MTISEFLHEHEVPTAPEGHRHVTSNWIGLFCPWCGSRDFHLGIHKSGWGCSCWRCGPHSVVTTLAEITRRPAAEIARLLDRSEPFPKRERPKGKLVLPPGLGSMQQAHIDYLRSRRFDPAELQTLWQLRGIGLASRLAWRVFIPIVWRGGCVSWTTRSISDDHPLRYISAKPEEELLPGRKLLLGEDYARHAVIITEGPFDAFRIGPGAVATMGVSYSRSQLAKLSKYPVRVVLFDSDDEGQRRAKRLAEALSVFPGQTSRVEIDAPDPASARAKEIKKLRKEFLE